MNGWVGRWINSRRVWWKRRKVCVDGWVGGLTGKDSIQMG